jgi:hypothetical protein
MQTGKQNKRCKHNRFKTVDKANHIYECRTCGFRPKDGKAYKRTLAKRRGG